MHFLWKDFPIETNEKFCIKKDRFYTCFDHLFHDVWATISKVICKRMETYVFISLFFHLSEIPPFWNVILFAHRRKKKSLTTKLRIRRDEENKWKENYKRLYLGIFKSKVWTQGEQQPEKFCALCFQGVSSVATELCCYSMCNNSIIKSTELQLCCKFTCSLRAAPKQHNSETWNHGL